MFDTVAGPNVRLVDNAIQLVAAVLGGAAGAVAAPWFAGGVPGGMVMGLICGAIAGVFLSGIGIGVFRFVNALRKR